MSRSAALELFDADTSIPVYDNVFQSPLSDFEKAVADAGVEDRVVYLDRGDTYEPTVPETAEAERRVPRRICRNTLSLQWPYIICCMFTYRILVWSIKIQNVLRN